MGHMIIGQMSDNEGSAMIDTGGSMGDIYMQGQKEVNQHGLAWGSVPE